MKASVLVMLSILSLGIVSCTHNEVYCEYQSFRNSTWDKDSVARFDVAIADTLSAYDVFVEVRNNNDYPFKNLWLFVDFTCPTGESRRDTMECILANDQGKWYGGGFSLFELSVPYEIGIQYPRSGTYIYTIQQAMRSNLLEGVSDIGIKVVKR